jgi:tRNA(Ile)-lysidine synthase
LAATIREAAFDSASRSPHAGHAARASTVFAQTLSAALAPGHPPAHLAVAVSGGADSMALCRLAADFVQAQGGDLTALTVDHGLRQESAEESGRVAGWMCNFGIRHRILAWIGAKPCSGIQQAARVERYRLLLGWCRENNVRHLLLGHHRTDQAETVLHRVLRGSGLNGLAGMSPVAEVADVRVFRPLISWSPAALRALLRQWGWPWLEDPSNRDCRFARPRLRKAAPSLAAFGVTTDALLALATGAAAARSAMQAAATELLTAACNLHPAGFARLDRRVLAAAPGEVTAAGVARLLTAVGGAEYVPTTARVRHMLAGFGDSPAGSRTLCRCRLIARDNTLWLFREQRDLPGEKLLQAVRDQLWDGRFAVIRRDEASPGSENLRIRPFTVEDAQGLRAAGWAEALRILPPLARSTLPVLCDEKGLAMVPVLDFWRPDFLDLHGKLVQMAWKPRQGIAEGGCFIK